MNLGNELDETRAYQRAQFIGTSKHVETSSIKIQPDEILAIFPGKMLNTLCAVAFSLSRQNLFEANNAVLFDFLPYSVEERKSSLH